MIFRLKRHFYILIFFTALINACGLSNITSKRVKGSPEIVTLKSPAPPAEDNALLLQEVKAGDSFTCARTVKTGNQSEKTYCWGKNNQGQLAVDASSVERSPLAVSSLSGPFLNMSLGSEFGCILDLKSVVQCWGRNDANQLASTSVQKSTTPLVVNDPFPEKVSQLAVGIFHTCVLTEQGNVQCFGSNANAIMPTTNVPLNSNSFLPIAMNLSDLTIGTNISKIISQGYSVAILINDGTIYCWGGNAAGQCGVGNTNATVPFSQAIMPAGVRFKDISAAERLLCGLSETNTLYCAGFNGNSAVGEASTTNRLVLTLASALNTTSIRSLPEFSVSGNQNCVITTSGGIRCWGRNDGGQLGANLINTTQATPLDVQTNTGTLLSSMNSISIGNAHACALRTDGTVWCWGGGNGRLGNNSSNSSSVAVQAQLSGPAKKIRVGYHHACAIMEDERVQCWGLGANGRLGNNSVSNTTVGTFVQGLQGPISDIQGGIVHTCALLQTGLVSCWGSNSNGQIGSSNYNLNRLTASTFLPYYGGMTAATAIATGAAHACVLTNGFPKCFGRNTQGQLGNETLNNASSPTYVSNLPTYISQMALGDGFSCFLGTNSLVYCTGDNSFGQLGTGNLTNSAIVQPAVISSVSKIAAGKFHMCAVSTEGALSCWGRNDSGQLGDGTSIRRTLPRAIPVSEKVTDVVAGGSHTCVLSETKRVYCFGNNYFGQLGINSDADSPVPVEVESLRGQQVSSLTEGDNHTCAIAGDNKTYCWGANESGQLGNNSLSSSPIPILVNAPLQK